MKNIYTILIKPIFDSLFALLMLIIFSPIFLFVYLLIYTINNGNVFFCQKRPGKNERIFSLIKFKTMTDKVDENGNLLSDEERLTKWGKILRKSSLDELPQLLNVLKGNMSIVGPRPLLPEYLALYNEQQKKRHLVKPGITGWAQINGRNAISWEEKFKYDVWYIENINFILDIKIFFLTIIKVFRSEGVNKSGEATTSPFTGNRK